MSSITTPWIKAWIEKREAQQRDQQTREARMSKARAIVKLESPDYWVQLCREIIVQAKECAKGLKISIRVSDVPDSRGEGYSCLTVDAADNFPDVIEAHIRLSYGRQEPIILLYRRPPNQAVGEEIKEIKLAVTASQNTVAYYFGKPYAPLELARELLQFLIRSTDPSQTPTTDDQIEID